MTNKDLVQRAKDLGYIVTKEFGQGFVTPDGTIIRNKKTTGETFVHEQMAAEILGASEQEQDEIRRFLLGEREAGTWTVRLMSEGWVRKTGERDFEVFSLDTKTSRLVNDLLFDRAVKDGDEFVCVDEAIRPGRGLCFTLNEFAESDFDIRKVRSVGRDQLRIKEDKVNECLFDVNLDMAFVVEDLTELSSEIRSVAAEARASSRLPDFEHIAELGRGAALLQSNVDIVLSKDPELGTKLKEALSAIDRAADAFSSDELSRKGFVDAASAADSDIQSELPFYRASLAIDVTKCLIPELAADIDSTLVLKRLRGEI